MPDFGNEFIIESYKIPWLIWIQLLVMILLIVLLFFGFSIFTSDPSPSCSAASTSTGGGAATPAHPKKPISSQRSSKPGQVEAQRTRRNEEASTEFAREEDQSAEESSSKDSMVFRLFRHTNHPCNFFGLAKKALFKCFGLDPSSELSSSHQHEKQE